MIKMHPVKFFLMYPYLWYFPYKKKYTIEQAEKEHLVYGQLWEEPIPFGKMNTFWKGFKSKIQEGDKLYLYRSPIRNWFRLAGVEKFILERDGKVIASHIVASN